MAQDTIRYLFILALVLIVVVYFAGFVAASGSIFGGASNLFRSAVGQNPQGTSFLAYPTGA